MSIISRNVATGAEAAHDLIIVGGGIYGVMLALEAGRRNKRALLLEKEDFGGATSLNHLRTVHGGLRYLQSLDLPRFFESVAERRWFLANFPSLVHPLPCLMPLYGRGLKRPSIMRAALLLNDALGWNRNRGVGAASRLANGGIVNREFLRNAFPQVAGRGLKAGALWHDAAMPQHQRLLMELLRWACGLGATALNYVEAKSLLADNGRVRGLLAGDGQDGRNVEFRAPIVVNAAGPWCREVAQNFGRDFPRLFRRRLRLFNVLFKRGSLSEYALALIPPGRPDRTYFVHNWQGRMLAGTGETLLTENETSSAASAADIASFITDLNDAVPGLSLSESDIERIYSGILPATVSGKLASKEVILDHNRHGGPSGLFSVSGVKYTTSRLVAEKVMSRIFPAAQAQQIAPPAEANSGRWSFAYDWQAQPDWEANALKPLVEEEAVVHLDDLIFRRTGLGENPGRAAELLPRCRTLFPWSDSRWQRECERVHALLRSGA